MYILSMATLQTEALSIILSKCLLISGMPLFDLYDQANQKVKTSTLTFMPSFVSL